MTPETKARRMQVTPFRRLAPALLATLLAGCMADPDAPAGGRPAAEDPLPAGDRHSGASSSTNWPVEACGRNIQVLPMADSSLALRFLRKDSAAEVEGTVDVFKGGVIPVLEVVPTWSFDFEATDTLPIPLDRIRDSLGTDGADSLSFSLRLRVGETQTLLYGYIWSPSQRSFLRKPSDLSENPFFLKKPGYYYQGTTDSLLASLPSVEGKAEVSFYIPGSPYFWRKSLDSLLELGPLPEGSYPLRMLRLSEVGGGGRETLVELFEIRFQVVKEVTDRGVMHHQFFKATKPIWSGKRSTSPSLREPLSLGSPGGSSCSSN